MPLSEHEQQMLEQIEQALYAEDPKFASIYQANDLRTHLRRRAIRATVMAVFGIGVLLAGVITKIIVLGVAGFLLMLVGAWLLVATWQRVTGHRMPSLAGRSWPRRRRRPAAPSVAPGQRRSMVQRLEDRWQRRQGRP